MQKIKKMYKVLINFYKKITRADVDNGQRCAADAIDTRE